MLVHLLWERMPPEVRREFLILRAAVWAWQLAEPCDSCARGGAPWRHCTGGALFSASCRDRLGGQHGQRGRRHSLGSLGGLWQAAVFGFGGLSLSGGA